MYTKDAVPRQIDLCFSAEGLLEDEMLANNIAALLHQSFSTRSVWIFFIYTLRYIKCIAT